jgi:hypothetical protein
MHIKSTYIIILKHEFWNQTYCCLPANVCTFFAQNYIYEYNREVTFVSAYRHNARLTSKISERISTKYVSLIHTKDCWSSFIPIWIDLSRVSSFWNRPLGSSNSYVSIGSSYKARIS